MIHTSSNCTFAHLCKVTYHCIYLINATASFVVIWVQHLFEGSIYLESNSFLTDNNKWAIPNFKNRNMFQCVSTLSFSLPFDRTQFIQFQYHFPLEASLKAAMPDASPTSELLHSTFKRIIQRNEAASIHGWHFVAALKCSILQGQWINTVHTAVHDSNRVKQHLLCVSAVCKIPDLFAIFTNDGPNHCWWNKNPGTTNIS